MNGQPLGKKNTIRLIVILIILMGATQTLLHQWGYGAEVPAQLTGGVGATPRGGSRAVCPGAACPRAQLDAGDAR